MSDNKFERIRTIFHFGGLVILAIWTFASGIIGFDLQERYPSTSLYFDADSNILPQWLIVLRMSLIIGGVLVGLGVLLFAHCIYMVSFVYFIRNRLDKDDLRMVTNRLVKTYLHCRVVFKRLDRIVEGELLEDEKASG